MIYNVLIFLLFIFTEFVPTRYILCILGCIGMGIVYGLKVNLSVAIVSMVNHTAVGMMSPHHQEAVGASIAPPVDDDCSAGEESGDSTGEVKKTTKNESKLMSQIL